MKAYLSRIRLEEYLQFFISNYLKIATIPSFAQFYATYCFFSLVDYMALFYL